MGWFRFPALLLCVKRPETVGAFSVKSLSNISISEEDLRVCPVLGLTT
ncbi:hypothetical protein CCP3SC5AM1_1240005 [Gammaproteobacteria bacterium]